MKPSWFDGVGHHPIKAAFMDNSVKYMRQRMKLCEIVEVFFSP